MSFDRVRIDGKDRTEAEIDFVGDISLDVEGIRGQEVPDEIATGWQILLFPVVFCKIFGTRVVVEHGVQSATIGPVDFFWAGTAKKKTFFILAVTE